MTQVTLTRKRVDGKAVYGEIAFNVGDKNYCYPTLENADYLIPEGTYPLERTWSPKFKKQMPIIQNVPGRDGIRIHRGTLPEHSTGCVLVNFEAQTMINIMFNYIEKYCEDETVQILINEQ